MSEEVIAVEAKDPAVDIESIRAQARQEGYGQAREIVELCALAGMPAKAAGLLARGASPAEARQFLMEARAAEDRPRSARTSCPRPARAQRSRWRTTP